MFSSLALTLLYPFDQALGAAAQAIKKAQQVHLQDSLAIYSDKNVFFRTHCFGEQEELEYECLVLPPVRKGGPLGLLLDYNKFSKQAQYCSHRITTRDGNTRDVRLMVKIRERATPIDPLDFRYHNGQNILSGDVCYISCCLSNPFNLTYSCCSGGHEACKNDGTWHPVNFERHLYMCPSSEDIINEADISDKELLHHTEDWAVDFPSILFVYKPDDSKALYDRIKVMSNYFGGIPTQCGVMAKYRNQRNKDQ